ncbi:MAG TPA: hypothetical protein PKV21_07560 [bacterium]|nr:hypothetical protein [bacterium]
MNISLKINGVERRDIVILDSISKTDNLNSRKDDFSFEILKGDFVPEENDEVEFFIDGVKEFGGIIINIDLEKEFNDAILKINCVDYSYNLDRHLVLEKYYDKSVNYIIGDIVSKYATEFTTNNVNCDKNVPSISFNRLEVSNCFDLLADLYNYSWFVDYDKDIHFFSKEENVAPYNITDDFGYIEGSLKISKDLSQIRNSITIRGGEEITNTKQEIYTGTSGQKQFPLIYKFSSLPSVLVNGVAKSVGVDNLDKEEDYDCFWNFNQKYIRFKEDMNEKTIVVSGTPLVPIIVQKIDYQSAAKYGIYEHFKEDKNITSRAAAIEYAKAQLEAYSGPIIEGSFDTNLMGFRSGQKININSDVLEVNEDFIIESVDFSFIGKDKGVWKIKFATLKTIGILTLLQNMIKLSKEPKYDVEKLLSLIGFSDSLDITDSLSIIFPTSPPYYWGDCETNEGTWDFSTWD